MKNKMTNEKALQIMNHRKDICNKNFTFCSCDECEEECIYPNAINALEKQMPKKANHTRNEKFVYWNVPVYECPICKEEIRFIHNEKKYCTHCGQKLKIEEE